MDCEEGDMCGEQLHWLLLEEGERANNTLRESAAEAVACCVPAGVSAETGQWHARQKLVGECQVRSVDKRHVDNRHVSAGADIDFDLFRELYDIFPSCFHLALNHTQRLRINAVSGAHRDTIRLTCDKLKPPLGLLFAGRVDSQDQVGSVGR